MAGKRQARGERDGDAGEFGRTRQCALTRASLPPDDLLRFVLAPDGTIVPDLDCRLPGRGAWLTATRETVEKAIKSKSLSRSFKADAQPMSDMAGRIEGLLARRVSDTLALANKAGLAVAGFQQVDSALDKAAVAALIHGRDAAADGCHKLDRKFRAIQRDLGRPAPIVMALTINEISLAMGRPSVVHAALIPGGLTERFLREVGRLERYRTSPVDPELTVSRHDHGTETKNVG